MYAAIHQGNRALPAPNNRQADGRTLDKAKTGKMSAIYKVLTPYRGLLRISRCRIQIALPWLA